jgi:hypothetical protein
VTRYICVKGKCGQKTTTIIQAQTYNKDSSADIRIAFIK